MMSARYTLLFGLSDRRLAEMEQENKVKQGRPPAHPPSHCPHPPFQRNLSAGNEDRFKILEA